MFFICIGYNEINMVEVFKWVFIWAVIGGSIIASLNVSVFDLFRSAPDRTAPAVQVVNQDTEEKPEPFGSVTTRAAAQNVSQPAAPATLARFVIGNTDRAGVYIRRSKADADKIRAWVDGTLMVEVGPREEVNGVPWRNVKDPAGNTGWIQERYLVTVNAPGATPGASATQAASASMPAETGGRLELLTSSMSRGYGFVLVEGQVRNAGVNDLHSVVAVVSVRNSETAVSRPEEQFIQSNPLGTGQTSVFKLVITSASEVKSYDIAFRSLAGDSLTMVDLRKR